MEASYDGKPLPGCRIHKGTSLRERDPPIKGFSHSNWRRSKYTFWALWASLTIGWDSRIRAAARMSPPPLRQGSIGGKFMRAAQGVQLERVKFDTTTWSRRHNRQNPRARVESPLIKKGVRKGQMPRVFPPHRFPTRFQCVNSSVN